MSDERAGVSVQEQPSAPATQSRAGDGGPARGSSPQPRPKRTMRTFALPFAGAVVLLILVAAFVYWRENIGLVKTDNAQTAGDVAPVSAQVSGPVIKLDVTDNQYVTTGAVLLELDPTDYRLALDKANADLAAARAQVRAAGAGLAAQEQQYTTGVSAAQGALAATTPRLPQAEAQLKMDEQTTAADIAQARSKITTAQANVQSAQANLNTAAKTLSRDRQLFAQGAIAAQQVDTDTATYAAARAQYQAAQDALRQADAGLASAEANREQVTIAEHAVAVNQGQISQAEAQLQQARGTSAVVRQQAQQLAVAEAQAAAAAQAVQTAKVNLARTVVRAPADGWVTNRTVEIGQVVQPNQPLLSVTLARHIWVVANIKETQLGGVRVGDPVRIAIDAFHGKAFHGHVQSIGATTGSTTALLPPDNATGNFVKVVQLVPVKISLDPGTDPGHQLQVGLSAEVTINTRHEDGNR